MVATASTTTKASTPAYHAAALEELDEQLSGLIAQRRAVVLDYGFWPREMRDRYKRLIESCGGRWRLLYFDVGLPEIRRRLDERNRVGGANALVVTERHLEEFLTR